MMNEIIKLLLAFMAGIVLGIVFFGGLWLTVKNGLQSKWSTLIFAGSFLVRMAIILVSFYFMVRSGWKITVAGLAGFLLARVIVVYLTKNKDQLEVDYKKETHHET